MWVRLRSIQYIEANGVQVTYRHGDWVNVGKQTAMRWLIEGAADLPTKEIDKFIGDGAGVVVQGKAFDTMPVYPGLKVVVGDPCIAFERTLIWDTSIAVRMELIPFGLSLLDRWQVAVPLWSYDQLAVHVGSEADRAMTLSVIHDLRIPMYDDRVIFAKSCPEVGEVIKRWRVDVAAGCETKHAFLRAVYTVKPFILALPLTWTHPEGITV